MSARVLRSTLELDEVRDSELQGLGESLGRRPSRAGQFLRMVTLLNP